VLVGYGPLFVPPTFAAIAQLRADLKWDKTIKSGKAKIRPDVGSERFRPVDG
jgi:hypothetical protein